MDELINNLLSLNFIIVCVAIFSATQLTRHVVEYFIDSNNKLWRDVVLPSLAILLGSLGAFLPSELMLGDFTSFRAKVLTGIFAGFCSSYVVRILRSFLKKKAN